MSRERTLGMNPYTRWSFVFAAGAVVLVLLGISSARETYQGWKVEQEIQGLQAQVAALEGRKLHLTELLSQLHSPDALDKEARLRLGLQKPGEQVFVLGQAANARTITAPSFAALSGSEPEEIVSNPHKWLRYFFHPDS